MRYWVQTVCDRSICKSWKYVKDFLIKIGNQCNRSCLKVSRNGFVAASTLDIIVWNQWLPCNGCEMINNHPLNVCNQKHHHYSDVTAQRGTRAWVESFSHFYIFVTLHFIRPEGFPMHVIAIVWRNSAWSNWFMWSWQLYLRTAMIDGFNHSSNIPPTCQDNSESTIAKTRNSKPSDLQQAARPCQDIDCISATH